MPMMNVYFDDEEYDIINKYAIIMECSKVDAVKRIVKRFVNE